LFQQHHFLSARAALVAGEPEVVDARRDLAVISPGSGCPLPLASLNVMWERAWIITCPIGWPSVA
jgi:hypothetical protein